MAAVAGLLVMNAILKPKPQTKLLQAALADQFGSNSAAVVPNIPARGGRYPGAVLAVSEKGGELLVRRADRPATAPPVSGSLKAAALADASIAWQLAGKAFGGSLHGKGSAVVEVDLNDVRIYEEEAGQLAESLLSDDSVKRARASGQAVAVVTRSYEALPVITVKQSSETKTEDWTKLKDELSKAKGEITADNNVVFRSKEPQVVAYEISDVKLIAGNFSAGDVKIELKRRFSVSNSGAVPLPAEFGGTAAGGGVACATIGCAVYADDEFGDLPEAQTSATLAGELFMAAGSEILDTGLSSGSRLTAEAFSAARARLVESLTRRKPRAFVLYYAGHAVSGAAGASYLVMGDYRGKIAEDVKQTSPFLPPTPPGSPLSGSNITDLAKAVAAAAQAAPPSQPGLVTVADLHREFTATGIPFALLIDGCYAAGAMDRLRETLSLTQWGDYYGADGRLSGDLTAYHAALKTYGEAPYLRSENPVIFASRPGTVANPTKHPFFEGDLVAGVAPLGAKLLGTYLYALENQDEMSLGVWLRRITDFAGTGEQGVKGSTSWSDFNALRAVPMLEFSGAAVR